MENAVNRKKRGLHGKRRRLSWTTRLTIENVGNHRKRGRVIAQNTCARVGSYKTRMTMIILHNTDNL